MTLPSNINFPLRVDFTEIEDVDRYMRDLTFEIQNMYEELAQGINGDIKGDAFTQKENWTPTLDGTAISGTFTYDHQIGWAYRQGLMVDIWFDISWSDPGISAGNLYLQLPYKVANSNQKPFSEVMQTSNISYGAGKSLLSINAIPNTYRGEIWASGSGLATANLSVPTSGQLIGHCRYLGVQNEP